MGIQPKKFLSKLIEKGLIDQTTADKHEIDALKRDMSIDEYLLQFTSIDKKEIYKTKADMLNVPFIDLDVTAIDPQALNFIPQHIAQRHNILPYLYNPNENTIYVATDDPLNVGLVDFLEVKTNKKIVLVLASSEDIAKSISFNYARSLSPEVKEAIEDISPHHAAQNVAPVASIADSAAPIAKIVSTILDYALKNRASDIHIEPLEVKTRVRYRIDGILHEKLSLPASIHESIVSRIKILSQLKIDEKRVPQDGRFNYKKDDDEVDLRVSTLPTVHGEKLVMRLLRRSESMPTLNDLGLRGTQFKQFEDGTTKSYGIVLVTGPTGSGKTTTLYSILNKLNTKEVNISTLEDPVEYHLDGVNQVQVNPQAGLTFASGLRSFLRQDPNIILVGEIRDKETTQLAIQAALTGHLVFSTLHTNDAATAIPRLIDLGGEAFLIASVLNVIEAQRIARKTCETCKETYEPPEDVKDQIVDVLGDLLPKKYQDRSEIKLARGTGCDECNNSGYLGRLGIFEVLSITPTINQLILKEASAQEIQKTAQNEGLILMKQDGFLKALDGITTLEEIMRVTEA